MTTHATEKEFSYYPSVQVLGSNYQSRLIEVIDSRLVSPYCVYQYLRLKSHDYIVTLPCFENI
jgi:hypothetical protein